MRVRQHVGSNILWPTQTVRSERVDASKNDYRFNLRSLDVAIHPGHSNRAKGIEPVLPFLQVEQLFCECRGCTAYSE